MSDQQTFYTPQEQEIVATVVAYWKIKPDVTNVKTILAEAFIDKTNWSKISVARLKTSLKKFNLLPETLDERRDRFKLQEYSHLIKSNSEKMPGVDEFIANQKVPVKIVGSKTRGNGLYTTRKMKKNEVIWTEEPLAFFYDDLTVWTEQIRSGQGCSFCLKPIKNVRLEMNCGRSTLCTARYCNRVCKSKDTAKYHDLLFHRSTDGGASEVARKFEKHCLDLNMKTAFFYGYLLLRGVTSGKSGEKLLAQFNSLASVSNDVRTEYSSKGVSNQSMFDQEQSQQINRDAFELLEQLLQKANPAFSKNYNYNQFQEGLGAWNLNNLRDCFFLVYSHVNHSCEPNIIPVFSDRDGDRSKGITVKTLSDIGVNEELKVTYVNPALDYFSRQDELRKFWGFICACGRCKREFKELKEKEQ